MRVCGVRVRVRVYGVRVWVWGRVRVCGVGVRVRVYGVRVWGRVRVCGVRVRVLCDLFISHLYGVPYTIQTQYKDKRVW